MFSDCKHFYSRKFIKSTVISSTVSFVCKGMGIFFTCTKIVSTSLQNWSGVFSSCAAAIIDFNLLGVTIVI